MPPAPLRVDQQIHHAAVVAGTVDGLLDGQHQRVVHGFVQKIDHALEALERLVDQHVAPAQALEHRFATLQLHRVAGAVRRKQQRRLVDQRNQLLQPHQVDRAVDLVERRLRQLELLQQQPVQRLRAALHHLQPQRLAEVAARKAAAEEPAAFIEEPTQPVDEPVAPQQVPAEPGVALTVHYEMQETQEPAAPDPGAAVVVRAPHRHRPMLDLGAASAYA